MKYVQGIVKHITFYNDDNHYGIIKIHVTKSDVHRGLLDDLVDGVLAVTGYFPRPAKGEEYIFYGDITHHQTYGEQFAAKTVEKTSDTNIEGLIDYLSSDLFSGIGQKTAERVVETLGSQTIRKIIEDKDCLDEVPKLTLTQKETLYNSLIKHKASEQILIKLYAYGISSKMAMRMINRYKEDTIRLLEDNPYRLIDDIEGIGFERADLIAKRLGFTDDHPLRIKAMIFFLFKYLSLQQGHTYLEKDLFIETALYRLNKDDHLVDEDKLTEHMDSLIKEGRFAIEDDMITMKSIIRAEQDIAQKIQTLTEAPLAVDETKVHHLIEDFERLENIRYTTKQKHAIIESLKHRMMIITGGPGTGKTTVIKGLVYVYYRYYDLRVPAYDEPSFIHLIAPTGRAAKRMQESTGYYATTIHRFLGYGFDGTFQHDKHHKVEGNLFIVDEASMIDLFLAAQLLESLPDYANVVFVGDDAQLPSVGPGQVFKDMIDAKSMPMVTLDVIHRQAEDSKIIDLAQHIRTGRLPDDIDRQFDDRYVFKETPTNYQSRLKNIIDYLLSKNYHLIDDIQVLIPMYRGPVGIDETNRFIQDTYNQHPGKKLHHGQRVFKINDKVLQLVNQIEDGIMNGDQGKVVDIDEENGELYVDFIDNIVKYKSKDLIHLTHAYAMSIHKSQGSEYKVVIMPIFSSYSVMLKRKLIYTGITRAKERVILFGHTDKLAYAVKALEDARKTRLKDRLLQHTESVTYNEDIQDEVHLIKDPAIPFETFGENFTNVSPYDFLDEE